MEWDGCESLQRAQRGVKLKRTNHSVLRNPLWLVTNYEVRSTRRPTSGGSSYWVLAAHSVITSAR